MARERAGGFWSWAAGVAAAAALLAILSSSPATIGSIGARSAPDRAAVERTARLIRDTLPEIPEGEALREAFLIATAERIPMLLAPPAPPGARTLDMVTEPPLEDGD